MNLLKYSILVLEILSEDISSISELIPKTFPKTKAFKKNSEFFPIKFPK